MINKLLIVNEVMKANDVSLDKGEIK